MAKRPRERLTAGPAVARRSAEPRASAVPDLPLRPVAPVSRAPLRLLGPARVDLAGGRAPGVSLARGATCLAGGFLGAAAAWRFASGQFGSLRATSHPEVERTKFEEGAASIVAPDENDEEMFFSARSTCCAETTYLMALQAGSCCGRQGRGATVSTTCRCLPRYLRLSRPRPPARGPPALAAPIAPNVAGRAAAAPPPRRAPWRPVAAAGAAAAPVGGVASLVAAAGGPAAALGAKVPAVGGGAGAGRAGARSPGGGRCHPSRAGSDGRRPRWPCHGPAAYLVGSFRGVPRAKATRGLVGGVIDFDPVRLECFIPSRSKCGGRSQLRAEAESRILSRADSASGIGAPPHDSDEKKPGKLCEICASKRLCEKCGDDIPLNALDKYPRGKRRTECKKCQANPGWKDLRECNGYDKWSETSGTSQHGNRAHHRKRNQRRGKAKCRRKRQPARAPRRSTRHGAPGRPAQGHARRRRGAAPLEPRGAGVLSGLSAGPCPELLRQLPRGDAMEAACVTWAPEAAGLEVSAEPTGRGKQLRRGLAAVLFPDAPDVYDVLSLSPSSARKDESDVYDLDWSDPRALSPPGGGAGHGGTPCLGAAPGPAFNTYCRSNLGQAPLAGPPAAREQSPPGDVTGSTASCSGTCAASSNGASTSQPREPSASPRWSPPPERQEPPPSAVEPPSAAASCASDATVNPRAIGALARDPPSVASAASSCGRLGRWRRPPVAGSAAGWP
ncbi:unnamed protein product [Prorocentrum cordatum]|uniref:Uncharacterized protein n=1 Tax=Prorocentrum cordatum TaxID=2364126 RepID=A0ABN9QUQ0_9DINO|nr:unnamed protein product [Polarella glacialis]